MPLRLLFGALAASTFAACAPAVGDACDSALDCSAQGSRLCDRTQQNGYCTIRGCERGTCPEDAVCVKFRPREERLAVTYCMAECSEDSDCRNDEGYRCTSAAEFGTGNMDAEILGRASQRFCSIPALAPTAEPGPSPVDDADAAPGAFDDAGQTR